MVKMKKINLMIKGMHCASCAKLIERQLSKTPGVISANVNYGSEVATVESGENVSDESLSSAVARAGYRAILGDYSKNKDNEKTPDEIKEEEKMCECFKPRYQTKSLLEISSSKH